MSDPNPLPTAAPAPAPLLAPLPTAQVVHLGNLLSNFETRINALETKAVADVSKVKAFIAKYWPIAAGVITTVAEHFLKL